MSTNSNVNGYEVDNLPILICDIEKQAQIGDLVDDILNFKRLRLDENEDRIQKLETKIDHTVYKLYGLTPEEIEIIDRKS